MGINIGIDVGSVSLKIALICDPDYVEQIWGCVEGGILKDRGEVRGKRLFLSPYMRIMGNPIQSTLDYLKKLEVFIPGMGSVRTTGVGGKLLAEVLGASFENEFKAIAKGIEVLYPKVRTVFEMGGMSSKYLLLEEDPETGRIGIVDYSTNGDCAAGTGSFMDQQAKRLRFSVEEIGDIVMRTDRSAQIAGRCSVFAKSDMIHAQQKGYKPEEILKGLCEAVARNFKGAITKGKPILKPVIFIGGVAANKGIAEAIREVFGIEPEEFIIPEEYAWIEAIGAAWISLEEEMGHYDLESAQEILDRSESPFPTNPPLTLERVLLLRDRVKPYSFEGKELPVDAYIGVDIGSVSTNLVLMDENGDLIHGIYLRTEGRPIEKVAQGLKEIKELFGDRVRIKGVGTTGSGRELIGELIGADTINDEITAHKTGAMFAGRTLVGREPDTIFDIGGQDSKFISIENGVVVDFTMNEACAAGTGSFLEERSEELGIKIEDFAGIALSSKAPIKLGERCTVFMEQDVNAYLQRGASKEDVIAGLAYSIAYNYINRVVRGRRIGDSIFFQGGTAYNDSVAAAFSIVLGKEIIVPPHNGVIGAWGAALLAKEKVEALGLKTRFRGYDVEKINYTVREFTCKGCSNFCNMQEFNIEGERTYWGDKCSERYRKRARAETEPIIQDLFALREKVIMDGYDPNSGDGPAIGIPRAMFFYELFPFFNAFLQELGFKVVVTEPTNTGIAHRGEEIAVGEPCFPVMVAHGHIDDLLNKGVDFILIPNIINAPVPEGLEVPESYFCPWAQTLPWVLRRAPELERKGALEKIIAPNIRFRFGKEFVAKSLYSEFKRFGLSRSEIYAATEAAYRAQDRFTRTLRKAGEEAVQTLMENKELGIILVGRPYNIYDKSITLDIPGKLRRYYGANIIPLDFLNVTEIDVSDVNFNMFWHSGRRILAAGKIASEHENLHLIYITNFKCGPDSFIKHYVGKASGKPFLVLQLDGHGNDTGIMTRCEAYLDSKGFLRRWRKGR